MIFDDCGIVPNEKKNYEDLFEVISNTKNQYKILFNEVANDQDFAKLTGDWITSNTVLHLRCIRCLIFVAL